MSTIRRGAGLPAHGSASELYGRFDGELARLSEIFGFGTLPHSRGVDPRSAGKRGWLPAPLMLDIPILLDIVCNRC